MGTRARVWLNPCLDQSEEFLVSLAFCNFPGLEERFLVGRGALKVLTFRFHAVEPPFHWNFHWVDPVAGGASFWRMGS